jgi:hypothetical protein
MTRPADPSPLSTIDQTLIAAALRAGIAGNEPVALWFVRLIAGLHEIDAQVAWAEGAWREAVVRPLI